MLVEDWDPGFGAGSAFPSRTSISPHTAKRGATRHLFYALHRPVHANDAAQARLFSEILQTEIAELEHLIATAEARWTTRCDAGWGNPRTPEPVLRLREKLAEVQRLLLGLQARFATD